jgi:serine/threonine-protein kinase HipA
MPSRKYENEGGPGIKDIVTLLRDASLKPQEDVERFIRATVLNWVIAATDAHAKNYALLHSPGGGVRLAPFYDILSYLPYAESRLHRVKLAIKVGTTYLVRRINRSSWETLAKANGLTSKYVLGNIEAVLAQLPEATEKVAQASIDEGLDPSAIGRLAVRILDRTKACTAVLAHAPVSPAA